MKTTILLIVIGLLALACTQQAPQENTIVPTPEPTIDSSDTDSMAPSTDVKTFVLTGENFKFVMDGVDNPTLTVKRGDTVRIEFSSTNGFHDWVVDEFGAATQKVQTNGTTSVEFVADQIGTFEYYCSVGQHRANGMWGNLIVEE